MWIGATLAAVFYIVVAITESILNSPWPGESYFDDTLSGHYLKFANLSIPIGVISMLMGWYRYRVQLQNDLSDPLWKVSYVLLWS